METIDSWQWITDVGSGYSRMRPLDEGGMGTLYRAHKDSLDVDVVIKRVKQKFRGRMDERAEANILKNLKHKYLPRIYDIINSPSGYVYTIMDYIQGENMQKYIEKNGPANQKTVYRWACQLCEAVAYLHTQTPPILHCDIKPSNVMITPSGDICVIDFNTSLVFSKGVLALGATPGYAAPEQYAKGPSRIDEEATLPLFGGLRKRKDRAARACMFPGLSTRLQLHRRPMRAITEPSASERMSMGLELPCTLPPQDKGRRIRWSRFAPLPATIAV